MTMFYEKLLEVSDSSHVKTEEKMSRHTTFRAGGPAAYYVSPADARELGEVIRLCRTAFSETEAICLWETAVSMVWSYP